MLSKNLDHVLVRIRNYIFQLLKLSNEGLSATPTPTHDHILNKVSIPVFNVRKT